MTLVSHSFEGGTDTVAFTAGVGGNTNVGGNSYFDNIDRAAGGAAEFSVNAAYQGSLGGRFASRGTGGVCAASWQAQFGTVTTDHFGRVFFKTGAIPVVNVNIIYMLNAALTLQVGYIRLLASGTLEIRNSADGLVATGTVVLVAGSWYRIEWKTHPSATVSYITVRLYADPTASIASFSEELNPGGVTTWAGQSDTGYVAVGNYDASDTNVPSASEYFYFDSVVAGAPDWVGGLGVTSATHRMPIGV